VVALNKSDFWRLPHEGRHMGGTDGEVAAVEVSVPGMKDEAMDIIGDDEPVDLSVLVNAIGRIIHDHWRNVAGGSPLHNSNRIAASLAAKGQNPNRNSGYPAHVVIARYCEDSPMAFIDDARHTGRPLYASNSNVPRQVYTLAVLGTSLLIWVIVAVVLTHL